MDELPVLLDVHDFWPVCPNDDLLRRPQMKACPEYFPFAGCGECAGLTRLRAMDERSELARRARAVVAHSLIGRSRLQAGLHRTIDLVDYGVDAQRFCLEPEPPLSPVVAELLSRRDRPRVLFLGPPSLRRGASLLVDLLVGLRSRVPSVELVVAGRDPEHPDADQVLWAEARELGLAESLRILPRVPPHDLPALNAACDVGIAPSLGEEPAALFVEQALASGLPVIASPLGAHEQLIRHGEEGLLLPPQDLAAFTSGVCSILLDPLARPMFQDAARLRALERHDRERAMAALEEVYERVSRGVGFRSAA
jgi:glycosyltransferase involved in cell wall biosynthesis